MQFNESLFFAFFTEFLFYPTFLTWTDIIHVSWIKSINSLSLSLFSKAYIKRERELYLMSSSIRYNDFAIWFFFQVYIKYLITILNNLVLSLPLIKIWASSSSSSDFRKNDFHQLENKDKYRICMVKIPSFKWYGQQMFMFSYFISCKAKTKFDYFAIFSFRMLPWNSFMASCEV